MPTSQLDSPRLYLNEHLSPRLASQLRKHGFDVISSQESGLLSESDENQLQYAISEKRAILTFNVKDFAILHDKYMTEGKEHFGIIFSTAEPIATLFHRLLRLLNSLSSPGLKIRSTGSTNSNKWHNTGI